MVYNKKMETEPTPSSYKSLQTSTISEGYARIKELVKLFLQVRQSPDDTSIQRQFSQSEYSFHLLLSKLNTLISDINRSIDRLNQESAPINDELRLNRKKHIRLSKRIKYHETDASEELIDDYTTLYNWKYLRNWAIFLGIIGIIFAIYTMQE